MAIFRITEVRSEILTALEFGDHRREFIFTWGVWKNTFYNLRLYAGWFTFHWRDSDIFPWFFLIPLVGFRNPSQGFIIPLEEFRYLSRGLWFPWRDSDFFPECLWIYWWDSEIFPVDLWPPWKDIWIPPVELQTPRKDTWIPPMDLNPRA